ncbi:MAG: sigma-54 dependent transcriptional regulator [Acetobacterales bacterium]
MADSSTPTVLLVEDTLSLARVYQEYLKGEPYEVVHGETGAAALAFLEQRTPQAILLDLKLPDMDGLDILKHVQTRKLPCSVVVITAHGSINVAVEAMRAGAFDFLVKPFNAERMVFTLRNAVERQRLSEMVESLKEGLDRREYCGFIGSSPRMQAVYRTIDSVADSKATVFITGESGTGKELCAEAVHRMSARRNAPFVAINCGAIPHDLMESEIFGHVKGAFTGAVAEREGAAKRAHGGTLFLDEICEMDLDLQTKLLRFVQSGSFIKVGGSVTERVDVRFVCATNRDPLAEVEAGRFREDLYYRLHVIPIHMPALRERGEDVLEIASRFLLDIAAEEGRRFKRFGEDTRKVVVAYPWPGNVRQLQNVVRNVVVLNDAEEVTREMLPTPLDRVKIDGSNGVQGQGDQRPPSLATPGGSPAARLGAPEGIRPLWEVEKATIEQAIDICGGNIPRAAAHLGISASTIYRKKVSWQEGEAGGG